MPTKIEALELVSLQLQHMSTDDDPFVLIEKSTIERPFGWVFFYNSEKFVNTGISEYRLAGNGPVIVNKDTGLVRFYGSGKPPEEIIKDYEKELADR